MIAFKYRSNIRKHDTDSLLKNEIYASKLKNLNDPYEGTIISTLISFSKMNSLQFGKSVTILEKYQKTVGIYSMSLPKNSQTTFPDSELMWTHYANSYKGFCIAYDIDILISDYLKQNTVKKIDVVYDDFNRIELSKMDIYCALLGIKSPCWQYENETRLIFDDFGKKEYNEVALKAVYFGFRMRQKERESIIKGLDREKVDFYEVFPEESKYELTAKRISYNDIYIEDRIPEDGYEILSSDYRHSVLPNVPSNVRNYIVLYRSHDKSRNAIEYFVYKFRQEHPIKKSNITIIDNKTVMPLCVKIKLTSSEQKLLAKHWVAFSSFVLPDFVLMYPGKRRLNRIKSQTQSNKK